MMMKIFGAIFTNNINLAFFVIMSVLFVLGLIFSFNKESPLHNFAKSVPTLLTSVGILGTFLGIVIALMGFDDTNIKAHINEIITGMQTAFITSVIGVFLSILLKVIVLLLDKNNTGNDIINYTIELLETQNEQLSTQSDFIKKQSDNIEKQSNAIAIQTKSILKLLENNETQKETFDKQAIAIEKLANAIGSDSENSLIGQITRMRSDINDNQKNLSKELENHWQKQGEFFTNLTKSVLKHQADKAQKFQTELFEKLDKVSEIISKSATEQVINALKEVIKDFNDNLTEQFGENFKELNKAVFKLVEWQDNYATQIEQMIEQYKQGILAIESTKTAVMAIETSTQAIPNTMKDLSDVLKVNQHQISELNRHLHAFGELQEKAVKALPKTQEHIELMIKGIDDGAKAIVVGMNDVYQLMSKQLTDYNSNIQQDLKNSNDNIVQGMNDVYQSMSDNLTNYNNQIQKDIKQSNDNIVQGMNDVYQSMSKQLTDYNNNIQQDLKNSNESILASIKDSNDKMIDTMNNFTNNFKQSSDNLNNDFSNINEMIKSQINHSQNFVANLKSQLDQIAKDFENYVKETNQTQLTQMQKVLQGVDNSAQTALSSTGESIEKQIKALQSAQQKELEQIIQVMGQALVTITKQFTNDYSRLVNEMDKVIRTHNNKF